MGNGYSLRVYNTVGVFVERHRPNTADPGSNAAEAQLRELGVTLNSVRGQKGWRSELLHDGQRIAICRNGRWVEVMS